MKFTHIIKDHHNISLNIFVITELAIAVICIGIPIFLRLFDDWTIGFRTSISDYVYMDKSYIYGMLLCMASMLFVFNGAVYFKNEINFNLGIDGKWYNIILGISLLMVILFPWKQYTIIHYTFAIIFFVGNSIIAGFFSKKNNRLLSIAIAILTLVFFIFHLFKIISLLTAEWCSLVVISIHFILEAMEAVRFHKLKSLK